MKEEQERNHILYKSIEDFMLSKLCIKQRISRNNKKYIIIQM